MAHTELLITPAPTCSSSVPPILSSDSIPALWLRQEPGSLLCPFFPQDHSAQITKSWWVHFLPSLPSIHFFQCPNPSPGTMVLCLDACSSLPSFKLFFTQTPEQILKCNTDSTSVLLKTIQCLPFALGIKLMCLTLAFKSSQARPFLPPSQIPPICSSSVQGFVMP